MAEDFGVMRLSGANLRAGIRNYGKVCQTSNPRCKQSSRQLLSDPASSTLMKIKVPALLMMISCLYGCSFKLFQPGPPEFKQWAKRSVTEQCIKQIMLSCGYPSIDGFNGVSRPLNEVAAAEECMFRNGFGYKDGYKGICSWAARKDLPACQSAVRGTPAGKP